MRLIDVNELEQHCRNTKIIELFPEWKDFSYEMKIALIRYGKAWKEIIQNAPTVDAVEVVRCKDCKHWDKDALWCNINSAQFAESHYNWYEDDFCSYGERKDNER